MLSISPPVVWLILVIAFAVIEGLTATALVSIWFSAGALAALVVSIFTDNLWVQIGVFLVVSCLIFALLRPLVKKRFTPKLERTNAERNVGQEAVVTQAIDNLTGQGQVTLKGQIWTARSDRDDRPIAEGEKVTVQRIEGVKLIVAPAERKEDIYE